MVVQEGMRDKWRNRSKPRLRANVDPRATFALDRHQLVPHNCRNTRRTRHQNIGDSKVCLLSSRTFDPQAEII